MASEIIWAIAFAVIVIGIILLFTLTVRRMLKGKTCCGNCGECSCCSKAKKDNQ